MAKLLTPSLALALWAVMPLSGTFADDTLPPRHAGDGIAVGIEYVFIDKPHLAKAQAEVFADVGFSAVKHYAEHVEWGQMQKRANAPIDFRRLDDYVREFQKNGFTELVLCLKPHSRWASKNVGLFGRKNASPKPRYVQKFKDWIFAVVERYDGDGIDDMPGLRYGVRHLEIGSEFSTYQPEPVDEYLQTLAHAYEAAHRASETIQVSHAAFLVTPANLDVDTPEDYLRVFDNMPTRGLGGHGLDDIRAVLDRPDLFDVVNVHNLGDPYEIEHIRRWLDYEMGERGYDKDIIISDITHTSLIAWGDATVCNKPARRMGLIVAPATESDRCAVNTLFKALIDKDRDALAWTRGFLAEDVVKKTVIAAEQGYRLIDLAFTTDLPLMTGRFWKGGAGLTAWGGYIEMTPFGKIKAKRPIFYATKQLLGHLQDYDAIRRIELDDKRVRLYEIRRDDDKLWVAWMNAQRVVLPKDGIVSMPLSLPFDGAAAIVEAMISEDGQTVARQSRVDTTDGVLRLTLTTAPMYLYRD